MSFRAFKGLVFAASLLPFLRLVGAAFFNWFGGLGANPIELLTRSTGTWTLVFLCLTLSVTPLRKMTGFTQLLQLRRMLGLFTFFYVCLHFTTYLWFDQWFSFSSIVKDVIKRPFITAGFLAFLLLIPLALTSTNKMMRRLGRNWVKLHQLIYLIAPIAVAHYWWHKAGKNALSEPMIFAFVVTLLLVYRLFAKWKVKASPTRKATG